MTQSFHRNHFYAATSEGELGFMFVSMHLTVLSTTHVDFYLSKFVAIHKRPVVYPPHDVLDLSTFKMSKSRQIMVLIKLTQCSLANTSFLSEPSIVPCCSTMRRSSVSKCVSSWPTVAARHAQRWLALEASNNSDLGSCSSVVPPG